jgi:hypothetical protein
MDPALRRAVEEYAESVQRFREATDEETGRDDAMLTAPGILQVTGDEDVGADPYNRTGRFRKLNR